MLNETEQTPDMCEPLVMDKGYRIIQIHPSLKCNLTCLHCYSSSAPNMKYELNMELIWKLLLEARQAGYNAISLSGGEPFLYSHLRELLEFSKSLGYFNSVTTNGTLLKGRQKNIDCLRYIDLLAFSIDGESERHNYMRNSSSAFQRLMEGIDIARDNIDKFGFIHTITPHTFDAALWLADFVYSKGAKLLQLHPLENAGRGSNIFDSLANRQEDLQRLYILCHYLQQKYKDKMLVELDLLHRDQILSSPKSVYAQRSLQGYKKLPDCFRELIVDEKGDLLPVSHGFSNLYRFGNLQNGETFDQLSNRFIEQQFPQLQQLFDETWEEIQANEAAELINWAELIVYNSNKKATEKGYPKVLDKSELTVSA